MKVAVLSDTHAPRHWKACPAAVARRLEGADLILHAGDVCRASVLEELAGVAPVRAVLGNNDDTTLSDLPEQLALDLEGVRIAMVHNSGARKGREGRMRRWFPDADVVAGLASVLVSDFVSDFVSGFVSVLPPFSLSIAFLRDADG